MCIAIVKPIGTDLPEKSLLKRCWENNPDGAGLMYNDGQNVIIHKGFTKFKGFYKYLKQLDDKIGLKDKDLVLHFRIATSGGVNRECTHPFPVTKDISEMKKFDGICEYGFAHNGIIGGYGCKDFSDTMEYIATIISNIPKLDECEPLLNALAYEHSSRFVLMTKDNFELGGKWLVDKGCYFSNDTYKTIYYRAWHKYANWDSLYEDNEGSTRCECCEALCYDEDLIDTHFGKICRWCYDELCGEEDEKVENKELVF